MKSIFKSLFFAAGFFLIVIPGIFCQQAFISNLTGTVELKQPGSAVWEIARQGQALAGDTVISTGFKSSALVTLGSSSLTVMPLTRLSLSEILIMQDSEKVDLNLRAGRVRAQVNPPKGGMASFTVHSPVATASVRGTVFEFDTLNLSVSEGSVEFKGISGIPVMIDSGRSGFSDESTGRAASPEETVLAELKPPLPIASPAVQTSNTPAALTEAEDTLSLSVSVEF